MALDVQISLQKLLTGLIVVIVPLSIVGLYLTSHADSSLQQTIGMHFGTIALTDAAATSQFIGDRIVDITAIAGDPTIIVEAVKAADHQYAGMSEQAMAARIQKIEGQWDTPGADSRVKDMMSSRTSRWLQRQRGLNRRLLKIIVSDDNGAVVAATGKPVHYLGPDQQRWQAVYAGGKGAVNVTDVRYDASTQSDCVDIAVPVIEEDSGRSYGSGGYVRSLFRLRPTTIRSHRTCSTRHEQGDDYQRPECYPRLDIEVGGICRCT